MEFISKTMRTLQNRDESDSDSIIDSYDINAKENSGWNESIELDLYVKNKNLDRTIEDKIIRRANAFLSLSSVIFNFNIDFEKINTFSGWTHKSRCPFPDHNDKSPSFGFNSKDNRFNCFGCGRGGGSVQFLAAIYQKPQYQIAKEILAKYKITESVIIDLDDSSENKIDEILFSFSQRLQKYLSKSSNPKALENVEKLTWSLDMYLDKHIIRGSMDIENISARVSKLLDRLEEIEINE